MTGTQENRNVENYGGDTAKADRGSSMGGYFLFTTKTVGEKIVNSTLRKLILPLNATRKT